MMVAEVEPAEVRGEPEALRRALENLIENGLVHGPPGGGSRSRCARRDQAARADRQRRGPGTRSRQRERLFERFWRGAGRLERPGSGLGLSIVAAIVQRHGGRIVVDGSAFTD